jgi:hypothetical protein
MRPTYHRQACETGIRTPAPDTVPATLHRKNAGELPR